MNRFRCSFSSQSWKMLGELPLTRRSGSPQSAAAGACSDGSKSSWASKTDWLEVPCSRSVEMEADRSAGPWMKSSFCQKTYRCRMRSVYRPAYRWKLPKLSDLKERRSYPGKSSYVTASLHFVIDSRTNCLAGSLLTRPCLLLSYCCKSLTQYESCLICQAHCYFYSLH